MMKIKATTPCYKFINATPDEQQDKLMEKVLEVSDAWKELQRIGNKVYCPFIDLPECHRGQHKFIHPKPEDIAKPERVKKVLQFSQSAKMGLCYKHRKYIISALDEGKASVDVADELGLTKGAIDSFMTRLMDRNRVGCLSELKNWIVE